MNKNQISKMIDHTILKADATVDSIKKLCIDAKEYGFASVCVNPCNIKEAYEILKGSETKVCTVIGFPLGATATTIKAIEASHSAKQGASEVDMVINIGRLKDKDYEYVKQDIKAVVDAVKGSAIVKVIIETCLLNEEEKIVACKISKEAGADFVKTSTGFGGEGAKLEDVRLMRKIVGEHMGVKASGGIHNLQQAMDMIKAGASRLGTSSSIKIIQEIK